MATTSDVWRLPRGVVDAGIRWDSLRIMAKGHLLNRFNIATERVSDG